MWFGQHAVFSRITEGKFDSQRVPSWTLTKRLDPAIGAMWRQKT
jgi:hypothetical protein